MSRSSIGQCSFGPRAGLARHFVNFYLARGERGIQAEEYFERIHQYLEDINRSEGPEHSNWEFLEGVEFQAFFDDDHWPGPSRDARRSFRYARVRMIPMELPGYPVPEPGSIAWVRYVSLRRQDQREMNPGGMTDEVLQAQEGRAHPDDDEGRAEFDSIPRESIPYILQQILHGESIHRRQGRETGISEVIRERWAGDENRLVTEAHRVFGRRGRRTDVPRTEAVEEDTGGSRGRGARGNVGPRRGGRGRGRGQGRSRSRGRGQRDGERQNPTQGQGSQEQTAALTNTLDNLSLEEQQGPTTSTQQQGPTTSTQQQTQPSGGQRSGRNNEGRDRGQRTGGRGRGEASRFGFSFPRSKR